MESRVKLFGHPIHPFLIVFPLGLLATGVIFDILYLVLGNDTFPIASFWMITAGILGGLLAAVFGFLDWLAIPGGTRAKAIGLWHGGGNVVIVVLFAISWLLRRNLPDYSPNGLPFILELVGSLLALVTGWLGGELVYRLRIGVDEGAHLDAPSSLSGQPASASSSRQTSR
jgi:uncharacterized membrane protein